MICFRGGRRPALHKLASPLKNIALGDIHTEHAPLTPPPPFDPSHLKSFHPLSFNCFQFQFSIFGGTTPFEPVTKPA